MTQMIVLVMSKGGGGKEQHNLLVGKGGEKGDVISVLRQKKKCRSVRESAQRRSSAAEETYTYLSFCPEIDYRKKRTVLGRGPCLGRREKTLLILCF